MRKKDFNKKDNQKLSINIRALKTFLSVAKIFKNLTIGELIYKSSLPDFYLRPLNQALIAKMFGLSTMRMTQLKQVYEKTLKDPTTITNSNSTKGGDIVR